TSMDDDESTQLGTPSSPLVLVAYPNPFSTSFVLRPLEGVDSSVTYQVYDITGKLLESRAVSSSEIGTHTIGENYPSGMYLAIATQGDTRQTFKMIKR
ncbi:T9SS type A sorting domain-containing protein, partial [Flavobacterium lacus]